jgi:hypothetical protein
VGGHREKSLSAVPGKPGRACQSRWPKIAAWTQGECARGSARTRCGQAVILGRRRSRCAMKRAREPLVNLDLRSANLAVARVNPWVCAKFRKLFRTLVTISGSMRPRG